MAACSSPTAELQSSQPLAAMDGKAVKMAIAKTGRILRELLTNHKERIDVLIDRGLLERDAQGDVIKGLKQKIGDRPDLFGKLLHEISLFGPSGAEAAKKLQGKLILCEV